MYIIYPILFTSMLILNISFQRVNAIVYWCIAKLSISSTVFPLFSFCK